MDEKRSGYSLQAPGSVGSRPSVHLPGRGSFPRVDDHLVVAEKTRDEIIGGRRRIASPAHPPHAMKQSDLDYVLRAHVVPGYRVAADLLTRHDHDSDFASDVCVFKEGIDPETGARYLEEIAFEVVSEQNRGVVNDKALRMHRRGVRRIFTIWVKGWRVCEWSPENQSWRQLEAGSSIEDSCLVAPLAVTALLDAAAADNAVAEALVTKENPVLLRREAAAEAKGEARGEAKGEARGEARGEVKAKAAAVLEVLEARGLAVNGEQRIDILHCGDLDRLSRWLRRAAVASSTEEVLSES